MLGSAHAEDRYLVCLGRFPENHTFSLVNGASEGVIIISETNPLFPRNIPPHRTRLIILTAVYSLGAKNILDRQPYIFAVSRGYDH